MNTNHLFTDAFYRWMSGFGSIQSMRAVAELGIPLARRKLLSQHFDLTVEMAVEGKYIDLSHLETKARENMIEYLAVSTTNQTIDNAQKSVDLASLVFAITILEAAAHDYIQCAYYAAPNDWEAYIKDKTFTVTQLRESTFDELIEQKIQDHIQKLERESLVRKIDFLHMHCNIADEERNSINDYAYDREKIRQLDDTRDGMCQAF